MRLEEEELVRLHRMWFWLGEWEMTTIGENQRNTMKKTRLQLLLLFMYIDENIHDPIPTKYRLKVNNFEVINHCRNFTWLRNIWLANSYSLQIVLFNPCNCLNVSLPYKERAVSSGRSRGWSSLDNGGKRRRNGANSDQRSFSNRSHLHVIKMMMNGYEWWMNTYEYLQEGER